MSGTREVLGQEGDAPRPRTPGALPVALAAAAVLVAGLLSLPRDPAPRAVVAAPVAAPLSWVLLTGARVETADPVADAALAADGALALDVRLDGAPGTLLLSARVELPGTAVVLRPLPRALDGSGTARLALDVLPTCPAALGGLARAAVVAVVRQDGGTRVREARVRLDPGALADRVADRCGADAGLAPTSLALVDGVPDPPPGRLLVQVPLLALGDPVQVVAVLPGPGLATEPAARLPLDVGAQEPLLLQVGLRAKGCGGAPDTPPFLLRLSDGSTVVPSVPSGLRLRLERLRPYRCTAP